MFCLEKCEHTHTHTFQHKMLSLGPPHTSQPSTPLPDYSYPPFLHVISGAKSRFISISLLIMVKGVSDMIQHQQNTYCVSSIILSLFVLSQSHLTLAL